MSINITTIQAAEIDSIDKIFNTNGQSWHVFGKDPIGGYLVIDRGCAGNWHCDGLLADEIKCGIDRYGIKEFTIYYGEKFAALKDMTKTVIAIA
jgi:hypothetical protein